MTLSFFYPIAVPLILGAKQSGLQHEAGHRYFNGAPKANPEAISAKAGPGPGDSRPQPQLPDPELPIRREQAGPFVDARRL